MQQKYKETIFGAWQEAGLNFNSFTAEDVDSNYDRLLEMTNDEAIAAKILLLAIKKAKKMGWFSEKMVRKQITDWVLWDLDSYEKVVKYETDQSNGTSSNKRPARETVQDWDNQELIEITPEEQEHLNDLMMWFSDRDKHYGAEDETYKQIAKFDDWQEWRKKRAISGN